MPITADELKKALAPITEIEKTERVDLDPLKVAKALVAETTSFVSADDPMSKLDAICDRVDGIDTLLEKAEEDDGGIFVSVLPTNEIAKEFSIVKTDPKPAPAAPPPVTEKGKEGTGGVAEAGATSEGDKAQGGAKAAPEGGKTETEKGDGLSDDVEWANDLAPAKPPTTRSERLTKDERPVPARRGASATMAKYEKARDRAMGRSERCTE